jgi:hypothetical protein
MPEPHRQTFFSTVCDGFASGGDSEAVCGVFSIDGRMKKIPFIPGLFFKTLVVVAVLVVGGWWLILRFSDYEITPADYGGTTISTILLAYLVHLWMMPMDEVFDDEEGGGGGEHNSD